MRLSPWFAALWLLACAAPAQARPLDLEDLLQAEELGAVGLDPADHWLIVERRRAYADAPAFDTEAAMTTGRTDLLRFDLRRGGPPTALTPPLKDGGYGAGPFSPDGAHLLVYRLRGEAWDAGIVTLATGAVRWLHLTPDLPGLGRAAQWRSNRELLLIARADLPEDLRRGRQGPARIAAGWRATAAGRIPAVTVIGAGRRLSIAPKAPARSLVRIPLDGPPEVLARGDFEDLEIAPGGGQVALLEAREPVSPPDRLIRVAEATRRRDIRLVDLATGAQTEPCPGCDIAPLLLAWSATGARLLVYARAAGQDWARGALRILAADRPAAPPLPPGLTPTLAYTSEGLPYVRAGWWGETPVVLAQPTGARADWWRLAAQGPVNLTAPLKSPPAQLSALSTQAAILVADGAVWRIDARGRARVLSTGPGWRTVAPSALGDGYRQRINPVPATGPVWARDARGLAAYGPDGPRARGPLAADRELMALGPRAAVTRQRDVHGVETLRLWTPRGPARGLLTLNSALAGATPPDILPVRHRDPGGALRTSWLYLPHDRPPGARLPLVVLPYPGVVYPSPPPAVGQGAASLQSSPQVLAGHGYAALVPSLPRDRATGEPAQGLARQVLAVVDAAIAAGTIDPDRLAIFGHSFGGYGALAIAAQTDRFRSVIAKAAVVDLTALRGALIPHNAAVPEDGLALDFGTGWTELGQGHLGATPARDPDRYRRNSPLAQADHITAPVLLIAGDQDEVPIGQSQAMFASLYRQGKDAELVTYWGERHLIASPANLRDLYGRVFAWLGNTLGPARPTPSPGPADAPQRLPDLSPAGRPPP